MPGCYWWHAGLSLCYEKGRQAAQRDGDRHRLGDPYPQIAGLRAISCPCLMLVGEYDVQFIKPAELVAREVPNCSHRVLEGMGHMLTFEDSLRLGNELLKFLGEL
jgi:pimeloyl-ACP methyl ester carboxylesterase